MAVLTIPNLTELTSPASNDQLPIWDYSDQVMMWISKANLQAGLAAISGTPTAGRVASWADANTVQDAGFAATDVARLSQAQTFSAAQTMRRASSGDVALLLDVTAIGGTINQDFRGQGNDASYHTVGRIGATLTSGTVGSEAGQLEFSTKISGTLSERGRITAGGHFLLGTTADSGQLTVKADAASTIGLVVDSAASPTANIGEFRNNGTAKLKINGQGLLDFTGTMGNSTKTVGTDAPADWIQCAIGGTTYYIPVYAA